ncbi:MAG: SUMF1/EgtB/PvdO family nonheme iron enzyme [Deltaproteobacteria bacterium]|nr:SUMF1/EgtB/PvdO family nonheme iron enzyme [Deltaproteobacteria bacterium]
MALIEVPGGRFVFGLTPEQLTPLEAEAPGFPFFREMPAKEVTVAPFHLDQFPVTNAEFRRFVEKSGYRPGNHWLADATLMSGFIDLAELVDSTGRPGPSTWIDGGPPEGLDDHPVSGVSWFEARAYSAFVGRRLPTEIEWEWAARGRDGRLFPWGNSFDPEACPLGSSRPVGSRPRHKSPFGVMDLGGIVAEWCSDLFRRNVAEESDVLFDRVLRSDHAGGQVLTVRATVRTPCSPAARYPGFGFRTAETKKPVVRRILR